MSLKVAVHGTIRKLGCGFLFAFHSNCSDNARHISCIISEIKRDIGRPHDFLISPAFDAFVRGMRRNTAIPFGMEQEVKVI